MTFAHVYDGRIVATYRDGQQPQSYKGKMLPFVETERPPEKAGSTWSKHWEVFEDRVEVRWVDVPLSAEEQDAVETLAETSRIRTVMDALRAGQGTAAERLTRLERVVGHLCKLTFQA